MLHIQIWFSGICYTFSPWSYTGKTLKMNSVGSGGGLKLKLNIAQYNYMLGSAAGGLKVRANLAHVYYR